MSRDASPAPGEGLDAAKMPLYLALARLGKRVLRPGGRLLTEHLLRGLAITSTDDIVEFAPGVGGTTRLVVAKQPASYTGIERDPRCCEAVNAMLESPRYTCRVAKAQESGLGDATADVVLGEAYLTMLPTKVKREVLDEAFRILRPGGRFAIHELALRPDDLSAEDQTRIQSEMTQALHVGVRPITAGEWRQLLTATGFEIVTEHTTSREVLSLRRVLYDEGVWRALRIGINLIRDKPARQRVHQVKASLRPQRDNVRVIAIVAKKP